MTGDHERLPVLGATAELTVRTVSDWHVGAGTGVPGAIDAQLRRDGDGVPYLPGTTLTGVLRDACRTVARALDNGMPGPWLRWHRLIFGDTPDRDGPSAGRRLRPAALAIGPARIDFPLRAVICQDPALVRATTFVKPGVCIDRATGRAEDDMLRFVEMARAGLPLQAQATLELPDDPDAATAVTALLVLGAAWCDRIGGDRRRGAGQMALTWDGHRAPTWAHWLRDSGWSPQPPIPRTPARAPSMLVTGLGGGWITVPLVITTEQPIRVPRQATGNLIRGHDHVPGRVLLPWLSQCFGADKVRAAVAAEALTARHAHLEIAGERSVPAPFVLARARYPERQPDGTETTWVYNTLRQRPPAAVPAKQVRGSWTLPRPLGDDGLLLATMALEQRSHNAVNRATQRPDSETGLYTVEVIPAGRQLRTEILLAASVAAEIETRLGPRWWTVLDGPARLGARRRGEYGAVRAQAGEPRTAEPATDPPQPDAVLELWVVADLVVRSRRLRLSADPLDVCAALRAQLDGGGLELRVEPGSVARTQRRDSWQSAWQLPRDSVIGLAAGSVLRIRVVSGVIDASAWADLLRRGLGERRAEGFGEVLVDAPLLAGTSLRLAPEVVAVPAEANPAEESELTGEQRAALAVLSRVARDAAVHDAARALRELDDPPAGYTALRSALGRLSASQRGTWRTVLADAVHRRDRQRTDSELRRWQQYQGTRRGDQQAVAAALSTLLDGGITAVLGSVRTELPDESWARLDATAVLLDDLVDAARRQPEPVAATR
jgi:CRISPR-associated protein Csx10